MLFASMLRRSPRPFCSESVYAGSGRRHVSLLVAALWLCGCERGDPEAVANQDPPATQGTTAGGGDQATSTTSSPTRSSDGATTGDQTEASGENAGENPDEETGTTSDGTGCGEVQCVPGRNDCPPGQKCNPWRCGEGCCTNSTRCVPVLGDLREYEDCFRDPREQVDDCAPTLFCMPNAMAAGMDGPGSCLQLCLHEPGGHGNCGELGLGEQHCFAFNHGSFPVCLETCDPLRQDCPSEGEACYLALDHFFCTRPTGPKGDSEPPAKLGEDCQTEQGCEPGTVCAPPQLDAACNNPDCSPFDEGCGCCARVCDLRADDPGADCDTGQACVAAIAVPAENIDHVGVCVTAP